MSTRANIIVKDSSGDELIFYRHSDGYPEGAMPTLEKFINAVKAGQIRDNVGQAAGWLIVFGGMEDGHDPKTSPAMSWKVGTIEPTTQMHGDIAYLYVVDLDKKTIKHMETKYDTDYNSVIPKKFYNGKFSR